MSPISETRQVSDIKIGFIGLGQMGRGVAANIQKAGYALTVHDMSEAAAAPFLEAGASWAATPAALAAACDLVFTCLPTPPDVEAVGFGPEGLAKGFSGGESWIDLSTNSVDVVRSLHDRLAERSVRFMDAPISGGPAGAASGRLAIWVGGDREAYEACKPVLDAVADQARYIDTIGAGTIAKLVHNVASVSISAVLGEVLSLGVKAGVDPLTLWGAIRAGASGRSRMFDNISKRFLQGKLDPPSFALRLAHKDISLGMQLAREVSVPMRLCSLVHQEMTEALNRDWGGRDSQSFVVLQQERAGVPAFALSEEDIAEVMART